MNPTLYSLEDVISDIETLERKDIRISNPEASSNTRLMFTQLYSEWMGYERSSQTDLYTNISNYLDQCAHHLVRLH